MCNMSGIGSNNNDFRISRLDIEKSLVGLGVNSGDTILLRAGLKSVGRIEGGGNTFLDAFLNVLGPTGTLVSLAFTETSFILKPKKSDAFDSKKKSNAGALPNLMINHPLSRRSLHPTCSFVAIGKNADYILSSHDHNAPSYQPVRKIVELGGKCMLIGCVDSNPGFTTTHLAEADLGLVSLSILVNLTSTYYVASNGSLKLFRRRDPGLCSKAYSKFYPLYAKHGLLSSGFVGKAYSLIAPAKECYEIDLKTLGVNPKFAVCDSWDCFPCNAGRWDRLHYFPLYVISKFFKLVHSRFRR